jgi:TATA-box binding protein (TBP) (component of TFIID and TFIIIB)
VGVSFRIVNVVATATLDRPIDLDSLRDLFPHEVIHDQEIYGGRTAYFKSKNMEGKVSIFPSGKMISIGTKSVEKSIQELKFVAKTLNASLKTEPKVQNIVATANLGFEVDLYKIATLKRIKAIYEPDQFPSAIIHLPLHEKEIVASFLLFASGKLVCVGLKDPKDVHLAMEQLLAAIRMPR